MIVYEDSQLFEWILDSFGALLQTFEHSAKTVILDQKQQLFFRFAVMIQSGEAHASRPRYIAHRGGVIALLGKNARRGPQDQFELLIVTRKIFFGIQAHLITGSAGALARISLLHISFSFATRLRASRSMRARAPALPVFAFALKADVFKLEWLAFDSRCRRRDPVRDLAGLRDRLH